MQLIIPTIHMAIGGGTFVVGMGIICCVRKIRNGIKRRAQVKKDAQKAKLDLRRNKLREVLPGDWYELFFACNEIRYFVVMHQLIINFCNERADDADSHPLFSEGAYELVNLADPNEAEWFAVRRREIQAALIPFVLAQANKNIAHVQKTKST